jgi:putative N6-adenine-specific DNA methylase
MGELTALGATNLKPLYRAVSFDADERTFYEVHLRLRTASRVLKVIKEFPAASPEMLYSQARRIPWADLFDITRTFMIEGVPGDRGPGKMTANEIGKRVREALQDVFWRKLGRVPKVDLEDPKVVIVAHVLGGRCTLSFDTSGKALHKRGYREDGHPAPLKETMAAAMLLASGYDGSQALMDPMCGTGTLAIEAAMIALGKPPQIHRAKGDFLFEWLTAFNRPLWKTVQDEARAERRDAPTAPIVASDINPAYVELARKSALKARVEKHIEFRIGNAKDATPPAPTGILITNLPYGERLNNQDPDLLALYKSIGDNLKKRFTGWRAALLAAEKGPWKHIGLKTTKRLSLKNGALDVKLLIFDLYEGSRKRAHGEASERAAPEAEGGRMPLPPRSPDGGASMQL